jgi:hypothetical protein
VLRERRRSQWRRGNVALILPLLLAVLLLVLLLVVLHPHQIRVPGEALSVPRQPAQRPKVSPVGDDQGGGIDVPQGAATVRRPWSSTSSSSSAALSAAPTGAALMLAGVRVCVCV